MVRKSFLNDNQMSTISAGKMLIVFHTIYGDTITKSFDNLEEAAKYYVDSIDTIDMNKFALIKPDSQEENEKFWKYVDLFTQQKLENERIREAKKDDWVIVDIKVQG